MRSHVFSYGHRNPLGLVFGPNGFLYESEHGPSTDDEVNLIESGRNYGWPNIAGYRDDKSSVYANWSAAKGPACRIYLPAMLCRRRFPLRTSRHGAILGSRRRFERSLRLRPPTTSVALAARQSLQGESMSTHRTSFQAGAIRCSRSSLIRGAVYRLKLSDDGRSVMGAPVEMFPTANRYRDIALNPDGRTIYVATDSEGPSRDPSGSQRTLANPGSIFEFTLSNN